MTYNDDHWMHRPVHVPGQLQLSQANDREIDREGSHPGEKVIPGFPLGQHVETLPTAFEAGGHRGEVIGYYRGNLVLRESKHGTTWQVNPVNVKGIPPYR